MPFFKPMPASSTKSPADLSLLPWIILDKLSHVGLISSLTILFAGTTVLTNMYLHAERLGCVEGPFKPFSPETAEQTEPCSNFVLAYSIIFLLAIEGLVQGAKYFEKEMDDNVRYGIIFLGLAAIASIGVNRVPAIECIGSYNDVEAEVCRSPMLSESMSRMGDEIGRALGYH